jgi:hypothetical protein
MKDRLKTISTAAVAWFLLFGAAAASVHALQIGWSELRPAGQGKAVPGTPNSASSGEGETLSWRLKDETIELTGYLLPVDREGDLIYEFMLVPITGICAHVPPPPSNQVVLVIPEQPYKASEIYEPVAVSGKLKPGLEKTQLFILDGVTVIESGYSIASAQVAKAEGIPDATPPRKATPWNFLNK